MEAHKCDRCGKYVDGGDIPQIRGWDSENDKIYSPARIKYELCPECYDAFKKFLSNKKEKE